LGGAAWQTSSILKAVIVAAVVALCAMWGATWAIWSWHLAAHIPVAYFWPHLLMVIIYSAIALTFLSNTNTSTGRFGVAYFVVLIASLLVGSIITEMIHCFFDRNGCINL